MTEQEIVDLGSYAEDLLQQEAFGTLVQQFEQVCFQHFMLTTPKDKMERESIYSQFQGAKDFLAHLKSAVDQKDQILQQRKEPSADADAPIEGVD